MIPQATLAEDYSISRILKGSWQLAGGHGQIDKDTAIKDMFTFVEHGITTFDCADIYTGTEEMIGEFLKQYENAYGNESIQKIKIHTKYVPDIDTLSSLTPKSVESIIDRSLSRLQLEQLHLVQFHWWDYDVPRYVETALVLQNLREKGKISKLSGTNFDMLRLQEFIDAGIHFTSLQVQYSVLDHRPEHGMIDFCKENNIFLICYGTVAGGFLSERYLGKSEPKELENRSLIKYKLIIDELGGWDYFQELLSILNAIAKKHHTSIATVASKFVLDKPQVAAIVIGARNTNHIGDTVNICDVTLDNEDLAKLETIFSKSRELEGDIYTLERMKDGKHAKIMKYKLNKI